MSNGTISVPTFYKNKTIFITGGTGFIGKVLIEKLLRSCPEIRNIYLLIRPKKGKNLEERIKKITDTPLFDRLKNEQPKNLAKIKPILGDACELGFGLKPDDRQILIDEVNIVFHSAASVRFDDPLSSAIISNIRSTRELVNLVLEMKNLISFVHISTAYCHVDKKIVEEKVYPPLADWKEMIRFAEEADEHTVNILTPKILKGFPNTYTFTKNIAETLVYDLCNGKIPAIIVRPSIVVSCAYEPFPGWIDNFNGPSGLLAGIGKGVLRTLRTTEKLIELVPVDIVIKGLILGPWWKQTICKPNQRLNVDVGNASNNGTLVFNYTKGKKMLEEVVLRYPLKTLLWYPNLTITDYWQLYYIYFIFYQLLPALLVDIGMKLSGNKFRLTKLQQKIFTASIALDYFIQNEWCFKNDKGKALEKLLLPDDRMDFSFGYQNLDQFTLFDAGCSWGRTYLMKDKSNLEDARRNLNRMWYLSKTLNLIIYAIMFWLIFFKFNLISVIPYGTEFL